MHILYEHRLEGGCLIDVYVYGPTTKEEEAFLHERIAQFHAQYVLSMLRKLSCPKEQKLRLVDAIVRNLREQGGLVTRQKGTKS